MNRNRQRRIQNDYYSYIAQFARSAYEGEERRESSIIEQAGRMQSAFSFVIAALFMLAQIIATHTVLSAAFLISSLFTVSITLLLSLLFATIAQRRKKGKCLPPINELTDYIIKNQKYFLTPAQRNRYLAETYGEMQQSLEKNNDKRIVYIRISMLMLYISLALCLFWFIVAILKYGGKA